MSDMAIREVHRSFRLPAELDEKLQAKADELDRPVSWVILRALEVALEEDSP